MCMHLSPWAMCSDCLPMGRAILVLNTGLFPIWKKKRKVFFFTHGCPVEVEPESKQSHRETEVCFSIAFLNNLNTVISACGSAEGNPTGTQQDIEQFFHRQWFFKEEFINFFFFCLPSSPKLLRKSSWVWVPRRRDKGGGTRGESNTVLKGKEVKFQIFGVATQTQCCSQLCKSLGVAPYEFPSHCQPEGKKTNVNYIWFHAVKSSAWGLTSN